MNILAVESSCDETAAAVTEFQRAAGLLQTGAADVETFNRLAEVYNNFFEQVCS